MIISKPKYSTLFSLVIFLAIAYGLVIFTLINFMSAEQKAVYQYAILILISPIAIGVTIKILYSYKTIKIGRGKLVIHYPFRFKSLDFKLRQIEKWEETIIKAGSNVIKELSITFEDQVQVKLTKQENSAYEEIINYLKKKCPKKRTGIT